MANFDFCGDAYKARSIYQNDQELINWFPEIDQRKSAGERGYIALYPTPGMVEECQLISGEVRALHVLPGGEFMMAVSFSKVYLVQLDYTATIVGTLYTSNGRCSMTDNGQSVYIVDGGNRYTYNISTGVFAVVDVTDGPFSSAATVDEVDNIFVYNRPGTREWAASNVSSTVTNPLSLGQKFSSSDNLITLIVDHRQVYLLGEKTSEININAGTAPFSFQIIPGTTIQHGCAAIGSVSRLGESFAFIAQDTRGSSQVVQMSGYSLVKISNFAIDNELSNTYLADAIAFTYQLGGHEFYVLVFPTSNKTIVYDSSTGMWHKWLEINSLGEFGRIRANCAAFFGGQNIVGDYQNGKLYSLRQNVYTHAGDKIKRVRRCSHLTVELNRVFYSELQIQFQPGVGLTTGLGSDPQAMLVFSDDGGATWSREYWRNIGRTGQYANRCRWTQMGTGRDRIFEVSVTDPVNAVIISANLVAEPGAH